MTYLCIILVGTGIAAFINWAVYSWAWSARAISPWSTPNPDAPPRHWTDRIPIVGWLGLRREKESHIRRQKEILRRFEPAGINVKPENPRIYALFFWWRPLLIELLYGPILAGLYWWEVEQLGLIDAAALVGLTPAGLAGLQDWMTLLFLVHAFLMTLLMIATFIDFDEQTIPDAVTIPGTLIALALAVLGTTLLPAVALPFCLPWSHSAGIDPVIFTSPAPWAAKWSTTGGLLLSELIFALWCFSLANRRWITRHGFSKAISYFFGGLVKHEMLLLGRWKTKVWVFLSAMWLAGSLMIALIYIKGSANAWVALLSALVGMGIGGGQIWAVRIVARIALGKEAMGFGDVTLMAMVGAIIGWQASLFGFFLAPFTAMIIVLTSWLLTGNRMLPFGPYLAAASMLTVVFWDRIWNQWAADVFIMGPLIAAVLGFALVAMCAMLFLFKLAEQAIYSRAKR